VILSILYVAFQRVLQLLFVLFRSTEFKELEIVVLGHELEVLRRHVGRPTFRSADRRRQPENDGSWPLRPECCPGSGGRRFSSRRPRFCVGIGIS
jgi:hypothetical protein